MSPCVRDLSKCFLSTLSLVPLLGGETEAQEESKWLGLDPGCLLKDMLTCGTLLFVFHQIGSRKGMEGGGCVTICNSLPLRLVFAWCFKGRLLCRVLGLCVH